MLTVLTWLWTQEKSIYRYSAEDVNVWASMVSRNLTIPHKLSCVTDTPSGLDSSLEIIPLPDVLGDMRSSHWPLRKGFPQCFRRLHLWHPDASKWYGERFVSMDLDCVVTRLLDPVLSRPEDVVICQSIRRRSIYNGSMLLMTAGARPQVWERISQEEIETASRNYLGSDQAFIGHVLGPNEAVWTENDGVYAYTVRQFPAPIKLKRNVMRGRKAFPEQKSDPKPPDGMRVLFFPGNYKPRDLRDTYPFIAKHYRA